MPMSNLLDFLRNLFLKKSEIWANSVWAVILWSIVKNEPLFCFKMILSYISNVTENKRMRLALMFWCFIKLSS